MVSCPHLPYHFIMIQSVSCLGFPLSSKAGTPVCCVRARWRFPREPGASGWWSRCMNCLFSYFKQTEETTIWTVNIKCVKSLCTHFYSDMNILVLKTPCWRQCTRNPQNQRHWYSISKKAVLDLIKMPVLFAGVNVGTKYWTK